MSWLCPYNLILALWATVGWCLTLWRWRLCARALHQCQAQRAKLEWQLALYRKHTDKWIAQ